MRCLSRGVVLDKIGMLTTPNFISLFPQSFDSYWLGLGDEKSGESKSRDSASVVEWDIDSIILSF